MTELPVRAVGFVYDEDLNTEALVFAENADGSGSRLEIQRALVRDDVDSEFGMDTYCLANERGVTHYGGLLAWHLDGDVLELALAEDAAEALDSDERYTLRLLDSSADREAIRERLRELTRQ